jgi:hypothetical protein
MFGYNPFEFQPVSNFSALQIDRHDTIAMTPQLVSA